MPISAIKIGNFSGTQQVYQHTGNQPLAKNFQHNYNQGELRPVVKNDVLANKLDIYS